MIALRLFLGIISYDTTLRRYTVNFVSKDKKIFVFQIYPSQPSQVNKYADSSLRRTFAEPSQNDPVPSQILVFGYIFEFSDTFLLDEPSRCEGSNPFCEGSNTFASPFASLQNSLFCLIIAIMLTHYCQLIFSFCNFL